MRLHWKIFLIALTLILAAVSVTALTVLHRDFVASVATETEHAVSDHAFLISTLQSEVRYAKAESGYIVATEAQIHTAAMELSEARSKYGTLPPANFYYDNGALLTEKGSKHTQDTDRDLFPETLESGKCYTYIKDADAGTLLLVASRTDIDGTGITALTSYDLTEIYESYGNRFLWVGIAAVGFAAAVSLLLFAVTAWMLRPLSRMSNALADISAGDYARRLPERGGKEFRSLAQHINSMASSVEENVEKLQSMADGRKQYVDNLAHEMKTPLTSILCFADLLRIKKNVPEAERIEYAGVIVEEAKRMKGLSAKLLELATAGSAELEMEPASVTALLSECAAAMTPALAARGVTLDTALADGAILCDRELFKSLIYNIIDNAAKASEAGQTVTLRSRREQNGIVISVTDRGIGMSAEVLKKVTEPFYMADKSRSRKAGGAGLGLSLCVEIARRHNARITAKSKPGKGTAIFITVPYYEEGGTEK